MRKEQYTAICRYALARIEEQLNQCLAIKALQPSPKCEQLISQLEDDKLKWNALLQYEVGVA